MASQNGRPFTIAQLSDLHCGQQFFLPNLLDRAIAEVNELRPDVVVISGDLTSHGFKDEYALAKEYVDRIECDRLVICRATTTRGTSATSTSRSCSGSATRCCAPAT